MARCNRANANSQLRGFTLLELILALGLSVLVMSIIVGLIGMYSSNFTTRGEDIRRVALARAVLNMIADDLRSTVTKQEYDTKVLEQMLMGQGGGSAGGQSSGASGSSGNNGSSNPTQPIGQPRQIGDPTRPQTPGQQQQQQPGTPGQSKTNQSKNPSSGPTFGAAGGQSNQSGQSGQSGQSNSTDGSGDAAATDEAASTSTALPLGIYGSATNLTIDVSRIPRMDEYNAQQNGMLNGTLTDLPGDIKSVSYFVQMPSTMGVTDTMNQVSSQTNTNSVAGLVRRALDRAVLDNAESTGQSTQLERTGELVAPEVLALEFSYYDGTQWATTWDSSTQGLPWLVDISLAMQSKTGEKNGAVPPGISLTTMPYEERAKYGIEVYTLMVTIPGAQLQSSGTATDSTGTGTDSGMSSVGL